MKMVGITLRTLDKVAANIEQWIEFEIIYLKIILSCICNFLIINQSCIVLVLTWSCLRLIKWINTKVKRRALFVIVASNRRHKYMLCI